MKKRISYTIAAILLFFGLGLMLDFGISKGDNLETFSRRIEKNLVQNENEIEILLRDTGFIFRHLRGIDKLLSSEQTADLKRLGELTQKPYNLCLYKADSLVFWLNNRAFLGESHVAELQKGGDLSRLIRLPNGYFELIKKDLHQGIMAVALLPIKKEYSHDSEFLVSSFVTDGFSIPYDVYLDTIGTEYPIKNGKGQTLAWLEASGPAKDRLHLQIVFCIYVLGFIALGVLINDLSLVLVRLYKPWVGAAFMLGTVVFVRWLTIEMGFTSHFASFQTFSKVFTDPLLSGLNSLGELLINIVILVWMMAFFNREFHVKEFSHPSLAIRFGLVTLNFFAISLGMLMVASIFKNIILDSDIVFDFDNVFNLNTQSVLAMVGIVLLLLALFLFSHRMMQAIYKIGLNRVGRVSAMILSLVIVTPVILYSKINLQPEFFVLAAIPYLLLLEVFVEVRVISLSWLVGWLMLFSGLTAALLFKYNNDKDYKRRIQYAEALSDYKDNLAEKNFLDIGNELIKEASFKEWGKYSKAANPDLNSKDEARYFIDAKLGTNKYLLHNYEFNFWGFYKKSGEPVFREQNLTMGQMEEDFHKAIPTNDPIMRFLHEKSHSPGYLLRLEIATPNPMVVFILFKRSFSSPSKVYTELLLDKKYKNLQELDDYDYGIYLNNELIEERNKSYVKRLQDTLPPAGEARVLTNTAKRSELLYHGKDNMAIIIGKGLGGYIKPLSLFSYVFTLLCIAVILFSLVNYFTNALPGPLNFLRTMKPSLRNRFQFWVISMILFSFLGIGLVTVVYFQQSSNEYHKGRLDRKVTSALANVNYEIKAWHRERQEKIEFEERVALQLDNGAAEEGPDNFEKKEKDALDAFSLSSLIPLISEVHRLDVNIYDLKGNLITSSEEDIFKRGLIAPKMGAHAFQELTLLGYERSDQEESIGDLDYTAAYVPLKNLEGRSLAFMGIPYYARQRELGKEVTDFMSTLLNVYVFLLLIAGGLAIVVANSVTKALSELSESLKRLRLGYNEPIVWERSDEIGDLVEAYNRAVKKIEESSKLLAQTVQEDAWREMAKQVAHEIKNPLTPMKLSIQYLQHAYTAKVDDLESLIKRVCSTLVEQIESLAQIATEFSNFAKMPKAENAQFSLNQLAASVHGLFANERSEIHFSLMLPDKEFIIFADRGHLTRVMNNLIKNAIQAIPGDKPGIIEMSLQHLEDRDMVQLKITDNGTGIPLDIQPKVFVPNFSTKGSGTGLGLAICKSTIESFNGTIYFETEVGKGTTFFVELPLVSVGEVELQ